MGPALQIHFPTSLSTGLSASMGLSNTINYSRADAKSPEAPSKKQLALFFLLDTFYKQFLGNLGLYIMEANFRHIFKKSTIIKSHQL